MGIFKAGAELLGDLGFAVVKNSGRVLYGTGQAVIGAVSEDEELIEQGVKNLGKGAMGLGFHAAKNFVGGDSSEDDIENNDIDLDC
jgi:hypothetical protein